MGFRRPITRALLVLVTGVTAAACGRSGLTGRFGSSLALSVQVQGAGSVVSTPAGISCPITCDHDFPAGSKITLVAQTNFDGVALGSWTGCTEQADHTCTLTISEPSTVHAVFKNRVILVNTGSSAAISGDLPCAAGQTCIAFLDGGPVSLLAAKPAIRWAGPCAGVGADCSFDLEGPLTVSATEMQGGDVAWARAIGGTNDDRGRAVAVAGDVFTTGKFQGTASFGLPAGDSFTSKGGDDVYVARYRPRDGVAEWVKTYGSSGNNDEGLGIACDGAGHLGLTGVYRAGPFVMDGHDVPHGGIAGADDDSYFALADTAGTVAWALEGLNNINDQGRGVAVLGTSWLFTGYQDEFINFATHNTLHVRRTNAAGAVGRDKDLGGGDTNSQQGLAIAADPVNGDALVAGWTDANFTTDSVAFPGNQGGHDILLARLAASDGHVVWGKGYGDNNNDEACGVAVDGGGNTWLAGWFQGTISFATAPVTQLNSASGSVDVFLAKFAPDGTPLLAKKFGGAGNELCHAMAYQAPGRLLLAGHFSTNFNFGSSVNSAGGNDGWVAAIGTDGAVAWAKTFGGAGDDQAFGVAVDAQGFAIATGQFQNTLDFGLGPIGHGATDGFLLRLAP